jgi:hypothetical protein
MKRLSTLLSALAIGALSGSPALANPQHFGGWAPQLGYSGPAPMGRQPLNRVGPDDGYRGGTPYDPRGGFRGAPLVHVQPYPPAEGYGAHPPLVYGYPGAGYNAPGQWRGPDRVWNGYWGCQGWRGVPWYWVGAVGGEIWLWMPSLGAYSEVPVYFDPATGGYYYVQEDGETQWLQ